MICEYCGAVATFSVQENGATALLCSSCLDKIYPDYRLGALTRFTGRPRAVGTCPHCGWTSQRAKETGLVGCPLCYEALDPAIWPEFGIHLVGSA